MMERTCSAEVVAFLTNLSMEQHISTFASEGFDKMELLSTLDERTLAQMEIPLGRRMSTMINNHCCLQGIDDTFSDTFQTSFP